MTTTRVEHALDAVLARSEFEPPDPPLLHRWLGAALHWLTSTAWPAIARFLPHPDWSRPGWAVLTLALVVAGALVGIAVLVYLAVLAVRAWRGRARPDEAETEPERRPLGPAGWEERAVAAAAAGNWRGAAVALYQAVLLRLGEAGLVRVDAAKTPGDYRRELRRRGDGPTAPLEAFLGGFERVAYGAATPGPEHYAKLRAAATALGGHG